MKNSWLPMIALLISLSTILLIYLGLVSKRWQAALGVCLFLVWLATMVGLLIEFG